MASEQKKFLPVLEGETLVGAISSENISEFILLKAGLQPDASRKAVENPDNPY
jgi:hypothetical protein